VDLNWRETVGDRLAWHWANQARPRLAGLTDDAYRWQPVPGCSSMRPRAEAATDLAAGAGVLDWANRHR